jgi:uncharacterized coiled-coil protein SlyX
MDDYPVSSQQISVEEMAAIVLELEVQNYRLRRTLRQMQDNLQVLRHQAQQDTAQKEAGHAAEAPDQ